MSEVSIRKFKIKLGLGTYHEAKITSNRIKAGDTFPYGVGFYPGHQRGKEENMTPEAHIKRMQGLRKAWAVKALMDKGVKIVGVKAAARKHKRQRLRLRLTVAKEYREIQDSARRAADAVMKRMYAIVEDPTTQDTAAIAAGQVILERAYGKANQPNTNMNMDMNGKTNEIGTKELDQRVAKALERIEAITGRASTKVRSKEQPADIRKLDRDTGGTRVH